MPQMSVLQRSLKLVCIDTVIFFAMFVLVGHLSFNFWERYRIQNEISTMKQSLHSLKDTIGNIGNAYDTLHSDLKELFYIFDDKWIPQKQRPEQIKHSLDRRTLHDHQVQTIVKQQNNLKHGVGVETDKVPLPLIRENKATGPVEKNASTNTKNRRISDVLSNMEKYEKKDLIQDITKRINTFQNNIRRYKDLQTCKHICHRATAKD